LIKNLRQLKGYTAVRFLREFESKNWTRSGLDYLLVKIDRSGSVDRVSGSGRPRTARAIGNVTVVEEMALSQKTSLAPTALYGRLLESLAFLGQASTASSRQACSSSV